MSDNKKMLRRRIDAYDFAILEFGLYLDTHPWDRKALMQRQKYQTERKALIADYESKYGPYIVNSRQVKGNTWSWIENPWPWEYACRED